MTSPISQSAKYTIVSNLISGVGSLNHSKSLFLWGRRQGSRSWQPPLPYHQVAGNVLPPLGILESVQGGALVPRLCSSAAVPARHKKTQAHGSRLLTCRRSHVEVSRNGGTPKSSISMGFSLNKPSISGYPHLWKPPCT